MAEAEQPCGVRNASSLNAVILLSFGDIVPCPPSPTALPLSRGAVLLCTYTVTIGLVPLRASREIDPVRAV